MTLDTFFEKFDLFADAPDAVAKMRELVLEWAATGKLCHDESVEWRDGVLGDMIELISGQHLLAHEHNAVGRGIPYLTGPSDFGEKNPIPTRWTEQPKVTAKPGDILITVKGSGVGKTNVLVDQPTAISRQLMAIRVTGADPEFVHVVLKRAAEHFQSAKTGIAIPGIGRREVLGLKVVLPPLAEQKRIVAKVDELMALCDRLEAQQQEREEQASQLARASLARFADAPTPANLEFLFHSSFIIPPSSLRKSILTLAVQGKLVPQDPNDEPAEKLFAKLEREQRRFADAHKFRSPVGAPVEETTAPFAIPSSWKWCRLSSLFNAVTDGDHLPPPKSDDGVAFLTIGNITTGTLDFEGCRFVPDSYYRSLADFRRPIRGDILYTVVGATYGRPALVESDRPFCVQRHIAILKPPQSVEVRFLMAVLQSPLAYDQASASTTGTAQPTIPLGSLRNFAAPLPPLAEQRRIVAKVEQLMALVDALETQLAASRATAANLLSALVAELTAG
jgi:type I restriction enzyme S subunit